MSETDNTVFVRLTIRPDKIDTTCGSPNQRNEALFSYKLHFIRTFIFFAEGKFSLISGIAYLWSGDFMLIVHVLNTLDNDENSVMVKFDLNKIFSFLRSPPLSIMIKRSSKPGVNQQGWTLDCRRVTVTGGFTSAAQDFLFKIRVVLKRSNVLKAWFIIKILKSFWCQEFANISCTLFCEFSSRYEYFDGKKLTLRIIFLISSYAFVQMATICWVPLFFNVFALLSCNLPSALCFTAQ